ncbi:hypothetical protein FGO68_gene8951 [Halteria grandinella]|uniref:SET domain-containing protein n=1 Tax=Halteria grandinella TaxID=5974 RepID=A0A8J8NK56_HALGN|nr:hypothetical protein FGO68_gene8951 [Halteria grandinella]
MEKSGKSENHEFSDELERQDISHGYERVQIPFIRVREDDPMSVPEFKYATENEYKGFKPEEMDREGCKEDCTCQSPSSTAPPCPCTTPLSPSPGPFFECTALHCLCHFTTCTNRSLQKGTSLNALQIRYISREKGFGVFTSSEIPTNTFIGEYIGEYHNTSSIGQYTLKITESGILQQFAIDSQKVGNFTRFINHSRLDPNLKLEIVRVFHIQPRVMLITSRPIEAKEELRFDYGTQEAFEDGSLPGLQ